MGVKCEFYRRYDPAPPRDGAGEERGGGAVVRGAGAVLGADWYVPRYCWVDRYGATEWEGVE